jgi:iron complex outermembrane recepter protein
MLLRLIWGTTARSARATGYLLTASLLAIAAPAWAQEAAPTELPPVVVEGPADDAKAPRKKGAIDTNTRLTDIDGTPTQGAKEAGKATPGDVSGPVVSGPVAGGGGITGASTSIIAREDIERSPESTLTDIISRAAGVQTSSLYGNVNGVGTTVDVRGFGVTGASNTLILINGRRLNDWDLPGFDLSTIAKESVERIEITRGNSGAVLYGDGAVGGVINIVTRGGAAVPTQARIDGGIGSFATRVENITASGSSGPFSAFINGNNFDSDGYRDNNEFQERTAVGDFRWTFAKGSAYFNIAGDGQRLGLPGARLVDLGIGIDQLRDDRRGTGTPFDFADQQGVRGTLGLTYLLASNVELIVDGGIRSKAQQAGFFSPFAEQYVDTDLTTKSLTPRVNITQPIFGLPSRVITGLDIFDTDYDSNRSMFEGLAPIHIYNGGQEMLAGYWMQTVSVLPTTDLSAGGRIQWNKTTASDKFDVSAPGGSSCFPGFGCFPNGIEGLPLDQSETNHAWHLGAEQKLLPGLALFGRLAQSFRIANIDERIGSAPFGVPTNFDLRTQKSHDWEAGVRLQQGPFEVQSSYYEMLLTDEIHFDPVNFINTNLDPTRRRGVETIASWQIMKDVRLIGNLTYTDAEFRAGPFAGNEVPMVSPWASNAGLSWDIMKKVLTLDTDVHYVGDRHMDNDNRNLQPLIPAHTTVDLRLGGQIEHFVWSAAVLNLFDVNYFDYAAASAFTLDRYNAYPLPGRTYLLKAGATW